MWRGPSRSGSASKSSSRGSMRRAVFRCSPTTVSIWRSRRWAITRSATGRCASSGRITTSRRRRRRTARPPRRRLGRDIRGAHRLRHGRQWVERRAGGARRPSDAVRRQPAMLPDGSDDETCTLAAQDDSFFAYYFIDPASPAVSPEVRLCPGALGHGRRPQRQRELAHALDLISQIFHRDGVFLDIARANRIGTGFSKSSGGLGARPTATPIPAATNPACILPALDAELKPTAFAARVARSSLGNRHDRDRAPAADAQDRAGLVVVQERRRQFVDADRRRAGRDAGVRAVVRCERRLALPAAALAGARHHDRACNPRRSC